MENILNPSLECTDPDQLQFCLRISDNEFWYCEPNWYNDKLMPDAATPERRLLLKYMGDPKKLLEDAQTDNELKALLANRQLWLHGGSETDDFTKEEKLELLDSYGYTWDSFTDDAERNQIICEIYFEQNPVEFRYDI
ncbi:hypothetical protein [Dysgonomonas termitidis]|uniref:Uncharacterized protein n=1 Tax=Dysgonomonas termitidis TaxID=1516126 RepID=A0ABV9KRM9_9BACT